MEYFWYFILGAPIYVGFLALCFWLPDSAYGEEDVKVSSNERIRERNVAHVVCIGDLGRSPRMQYHAISLAKRLIAVDLIGYTDTELHPEIAEHKFIAVHSLKKPPKWMDTSNPLLFAFLGPLKALAQFFILWSALGHGIRPARWILVQNPPSIPTLLVAACMKWTRKSLLIIDWHNLGYSVLAHKIGPSHPLVRIAKAYEKFYSHSALLNFTVTDAMNRQIKRDFGIVERVRTFHDRPHQEFRPLDKEGREVFLKHIPLTEPFAEKIMRGDTALIMSPTSWTPDEDFSVLLDALVQYSHLATTTNKSLPELLCIITGKGPQKEAYLAKIASLENEGRLDKVLIKTGWFTTANYAGLLACADLGICLHQSTSGVDLPMKIVDMFGASVPVVAYNLYESFGELVKEGENGRGFGTSEELNALLVQLLAPDRKALNKLRDGASLESRRNWDVEWDRCVAEYFSLKQAGDAEILGS